MHTKLKILVLNGPNLNLLGFREPDLYGRVSLDEIKAALTEQAGESGVELFFRQSNHEGELIDTIHQGIGKYDGIILNPGGLTHTSLSLADAISSSGIPTVEVHLTNIFSREDLRWRSLTAGASVGMVLGLGWRGYLLALQGLIDHLQDAYEKS